MLVNILFYACIATLYLFYANNIVNKMLIIIIITIKKRSNRDTSSIFSVSIQNFLVKESRSTTKFGKLESQTDLTFVQRYLGVVGVFLRIIAKFHLLQTEVT